MKAKKLDDVLVYKKKSLRTAQALQKLHQRPRLMTSDPRFQPCTMKL